jgi:diguanylate cyclase (GGDEF)-like protein
MTAREARARRRVLVIDDSAEIHADFRKILAAPARGDGLNAAKAALFGSAAARDAGCARPHFDIDGAMQGEEGVQRAKAARDAGVPYHAAFVDMRMPPGWDGLATIRELWRIDPALPVVVCTAYSDRCLDTLADELGQGDRLLVLKKPFESAEVRQLAATLSARWFDERDARSERDGLERQVAERSAELEHALLHDPLTGLANRAHLVGRLDACIERSHRKPAQRFALLFLDLDRFKLINDSLGHDAGDRLLIEVAQRLRESLRASDVVCQTCTPSRLGGDEFLLLLEDLHETRDAARAARRLLDVLAEPFDLDGQRLSITASIGIATSERGYGHAGEMIRDADTAMNRAKSAGRARFVLFDRAMHREVVERLSLETALRGALREGALELHYQPIVRLDDRRLVGFEALVRWTHPQRGAIPASELIAVAEECGLIQPLGLHLLGKACRQLNEWQRRHPQARDLKMSINLSRGQLLDPDLVARITETLRESGVDPASIVLEITESMLLHDTEAAIETLERLRALAVDLHLDDFGTGYSALSHLYKLPLGAMKIDRSFIADAGTRPEHLLALEAIVSLARAFGLAVIAEGIETPEHFEMLRRLGVDLGQGYLCGRPSPAEHAERIVIDPTLLFAGAD